MEGFIFLIDNAFIAIYWDQIRKKKKEAQAE